MIPGSGRSAGEGTGYPMQYSWASLVKNPPAMQKKNLGSIPGWGRSPGGGNSYPLQYSGLENSMDCTVHRVAKSWTQLSDFHFHDEEEPKTSHKLDHRFTFCVLSMGLQVPLHRA